MGEIESQEMLVFSKIRHNNKDNPESLLRREEKKKKGHQSLEDNLAKLFSEFQLTSKQNQVPTWR